MVEKRTTFELITLGSLQLLAAGKPARVGKKHAVLLAAIVVRDRAEVSRDWLAGLLWPEDSEQRAQQSVGQAVYKLRQVLGKSSFTVTPTHVVLKAPVSSDIARLRNALGRSSLLEASSIYRDSFLKDVRLNSDDFDEWRSSTNDELCKQLQRLLRREWHRLPDEHRVQVAEHTARLLPHDADVRKLYIQSLIATGDSLGARQVFDQLEIEISRGDLDEVTYTWDDVVATASVIEAPTQSVSQCFVGRENEISALRRLWQESLSARGRIAIVTGDSGIGKTSLCVEFLSRLPNRTRRIRASAFQSAQHVGYSVLSDVLAGVERSDIEALPPTFASALADVHPYASAVAGTQSQLPAQAAERRLHEAATRLLLNMCSIDPLVLVLDDLQWADRASLSWLTFFARHIEGSRLLVVIATRPVEAGIGHLGDLDRLHTAVTKIQLSEFTSAEAKLLLHNARPDLRDSEAARLYERTAGHPFLLSELLRYSDLDVTSGDTGLLQVYVQNAVSPLTAGSRELIETLAAAATPLPVGTIAEMSNCRLEDVLSWCHEADQICSVSSNATVSFRHDVVREVVYGLMPEPLRRLRHLRLAEFFNSTGAPSSVQAHHYARSGSNKTFTICVEAATASELKFAYQEAEHFYELSVLHASTTELKELASERLTDLLYRAGRHSAVVRLLEDRIAATHTDPRKQLTWMWKLAVSRRSIANHEGLSELTSDVLARARVLHDHEATYNALFVRTLLFANSDAPEAYAEEQKCLVALLELAENNPLTPAGINALASAAQLMSLTDATVALPVAYRARAWAEQLGIPNLLINAYRIIGITTYNAGLFDESREAYGSALSLIDVHGAVFYRSRVLTHYASLLVETGDYSDAAKFLSEAERTSDRDLAESWATAQANQAQLALQTGDNAECVERATLAYEAPGISTWLRMEILGYRGLARLELGQVEGAFQDAAILERDLSGVRELRYDLSYAFLLLARVATLRHRANDLGRVLLEARAFYEPRDYVCHLRTGIAFAEVLTLTDSSEAWRIATEVRSLAQLKRLSGIEDLVDKTFRRMKRGARGSQSRVRE